MGWSVVLLLLLVVTLYAIALYNSCVKSKNQASENWSNIEVSLKKRHDELPKLISSCKQYMQHESTTLEKVIAARSRVHEAVEAKDTLQLGMAETLLRQSLGQLFALSEKYPSLKADANFSELQNIITELENEISDRRDVYNDSVNSYNTRIEQFPANLIAQTLGFTVLKLVTFEATEIADVNVSTAFSSTDHS